MRVISISILAVAVLSSCATVRQSDLDAWVNVPAIALDTHSFFLTLPMVKTVTDSGIEIRVYSNKHGFSSCVGSGLANTNSTNGNTVSYANFSALQSCTSKMVGCDGVFYLRDGRVLEAKPVGRCYTNEATRPEPGYERFLKK